MKKRIERILGDLESARRRLTAEVEGLQDPAFGTKPSPNDWSVGQVIEHLAGVDESVARGIGAVCAGKLKVEKKPGDWFGRLIYASRLYHAIRIRRPGALDTPQPPSRAAAMTRIAETRAKLLEAIDAGERIGMWSHSLRHPIFGPMSMTEMLTFVAEHEERHRLQIVRIKAKLEKAGIPLAAESSASAATAR